MATDSSDDEATDTLFAQLYDELHRLADWTLRRNGAITLGATTLLHEAYLNVSARHGIAFEDRGRFLAYAARVMRGLVIDQARRHGAVKRGRRFEITLTGDEPPSGDAVRAAEELSCLAEALGELASLDPLLAEVVDLHFFCGFTFGEIAALRDVSERTVQRDWRKARLLLHQALLEPG